MPEPPIHARLYIGKPFQSHGYGPDGYNCWGLVRAYLRDQHGIAVPTFDGRYQEEQASLLAIRRLIQEETDSERWEPVEGEPRSGDVAVMGGRGRHVGVLVDAHWMLSVDQALGVICERVRFSRELVHGIWRYRSL